MKYLYHLILIVCISILPCFVMNFAMADGYVYEIDNTESTPTNVVDKRDASNHDKTFITKGNKRLPPVLPGEEIVKNGKKMNTWSTSGPVPVSQAPEPFNKKSQIKDILGNEGGIFIDRRSVK